MAAPMNLKPPRKGLFPDEDDDEDDEWTKSNKGHSKFNFFDDSVTDDARDLVKRWKAQKDDDLEDDLEVINWDGTPAATISYKPGKSEVATPLSPQTSSKPSASRLASTPGHFSIPKTAEKTHSRSQSLTLGKNHAAIPNESREIYSIDERRNDNGSSISDVVSRNKPSKLELEVADLKRALQMMKREKWRQPSANETVRAIIQGEPYGFEMCKSREQKLAFLDEAIKLHDGNAITAAILFLQKTLKPSLFNMELSRRPVAINHYLCYLKAHYQTDQLIETLGMLGRFEEAAMLKYKQAAGIKDTRSKIQQLQRCGSAHFCELSLLAEASLIQEQISLLERQGPIEDSDARAEREGRVMAFKENPRAASIINMPVITTLYYCCIYHYDLPENNLASPIAIRKQHQLTDKQYLWCAIGARSRLKRWMDIEVLLTTKGWFGGKKLKSAIGFDKVVTLLHKTGATPDVLSKYLSLIDDTEKRLTLAKKYECHQAAVDTFIILRDRNELEAYMKTLKPRSQEYYYAEDALRNSANKWKT